MWTNSPFFLVAMRQMAWEETSGSTRTRRPRPKLWGRDIVSRMIVGLRGHDVRAPGLSVTGGHPSQEVCPICHR